ncbi:hypothetical protein REPUB_Repub01dG0086200 [Reevesia pubescens]
MKFEYEGPPIFCFCNLKSPRWTSWTSSNPGRRFYGCSQYPVFLSCLWFNFGFCLCLSF